jgi:hypothetical protein
MFRSHSAAHQHLRDLPKHSRCTEYSNCKFDGRTQNDLLDHFVELGCARLCQGCNNGSGKWWGWNSERYHDHVQDENVRTICDRHFQTPTNLYQVHPSF